MSEIETKVDAETTENESEVVEESEKETENSEQENEESGEQKETQRKPKFTAEQQLAIHERKAKQLRKQLGLENEEKPASKSKKSDDFNEGELALLTVKGIESEEDVKFTRQELEKSGESLKELLANEYFQNKLKSRIELRKAVEATPTSQKRGSGGAKDSVDYHYAQYIKSGELPKDRELREKVLDKRIQSETNSKVFYND